MNNQERALQMLKLWEHGSEDHRTWLRGIAKGDIEKALNEAEQRGRKKPSSSGYMSAIMDFRQMMQCGWTLQQIWSLIFKKALIKHEAIKIPCMTGEEAGKKLEPI